MTDYSKLSDAEIAEKVAVKLGWNGKVIDAIYWLNELLGYMPLGEMLDEWLACEGPETFIYQVFFDWPAPIMMQAVRKDLKRRGFTSSTADGSTAYDCFVHRSEWTGCILVTRETEPRALYEAALEALEGGGG